jgi:hypothetical protein
MEIRLNETEENLTQTVKKKYIYEKLGTRTDFTVRMCDETLMVNNLTSHLHLERRSRMRGAIPPPLQYASMVWCSVKKNHRDSSAV